jgi:N-methylhydantoinase B
LISAVEIEVWKHRLASVAAEMGATLRRTAFSPNIKERHDFSTAIFDAAGRMLSQGEDIPVHLGSMPLSVQSALEHAPPGPGDLVLLNDPFMGGTHLPDITAVSGVYARGGGRALFYVANRAHHSDVGGMRPGSMPLATEIYQEGLRIPPLHLVRGGRLDEEILRLLLANVRTPRERRGDLRAQIAANHVGEGRLLEIVGKYGRRTLQMSGAALLDYAERMTRALLRRIPPGRYRAVDFLDDDGITRRPVRIEVCITVRGGRARVDFTGSDPQVAGGLNAILAIAHSAVFYVFRSLVGSDIPSNAGCMRPLEVVAPPGSVVAAEVPAAVAGGNVETSQRIVDVLLAALRPALPDRVPAASCGSMNNVTIGGVDDCGRPYAYYETVAGGMGAWPGGDGLSGVHTHMTNSLNTPVEALAHEYPFRVRRYALLRNSGGAGRYRGGDGLVREYAFDAPAQVTVLSERRRFAPPGASGGAPGRRGRNVLLRRGRARVLPGKLQIDVRRGDVLRIETPGGGGFGSPRSGKRVPRSGLRRDWR